MGSKKQKNNNNLPGATQGTRQRSLCRCARSWGTRQRNLKKKLKKFFVGCLTAWHPAKADGSWPPSSRPLLPAAIFCRVAGTRQKPIFADGWNLPSARTRQRLLCRRPLFAGCRQAWHPAKNFFAGCPIKSTRQIFFAPGKSAVSCCDIRLLEKEVG